MNYSTGELTLVESELVAQGYGNIFGQIRSYSNQLGTDIDYGNGTNWTISGVPRIRQASATTVYVQFNPNMTYWFVRSGGVWVTQYGERVTLTDIGGGGFRMTTNLGDLWEFAGFSGATPGLVTRSVSSANQETTYTYSSGKISEIQRSITISGTATIESFVYSYPSSGVHTSRFSSILWRRQVGGGSWNPVRQVTYSYYDVSETYGNLGNLKRAIVQVPDGSGWLDDETRYYRYYKDSAGGIGFQHGLRFALGSQAYTRLAAAPGVTDPLTASDTIVAQYADYYFEYDPASRMVTKETVDAGTQTYTFSYSTSAFSDGYNNWKRRTVETRPDGSQNVVYTNYIAQLMLQEFKSGASSWIDYQQFSATGKIIQYAHPSAVTGYNDSSANLSVSLRSTDGLIEVTEYYSTTGSGGVADYVQNEKIKKGSSGTAILQKTFEYTTQSTTDGIRVEVSKESVYRNDDGSGQIDTSYAYVWATGTLRMEQKTTTLPAVLTTQNGSGTSNTRIERYDERENLAWTMDERGFIGYHQYDLVTGALIQSIVDVDTTLVSNEPSGWTTPAGGGLHLVTDYESDSLGRTTQALGPPHDVDGTTTRQATWTVYQDVTNEVWSAKGFATGTSPSYTYTLVNPVLIRKTDQTNLTSDSISATRTSVSGKLLPTDSFPQTTWVRWTWMSYNDAGQIIAERIYHTIPSSGSGSSGTNYDESTVAYDNMDRAIMQKSPGGTITRSVYDVRSQVTKVFVGTNDAGATPSDPTGGGTSGNNMVLVTENEYDGGSAGGDGNLTEQTQYVDGSTSRTTIHLYDWRNRRTATDGEIDFYQLSTYDNLNRVTRVDRRNTTSGGNLIGRSDTLFDDMGRVYRTIRYAVDPSTGTVGNSLTDNIWYDPAGNPAKSLPAGSKAFTKTFHDGAGRSTYQFFGYHTAETSYADALTITGDFIFEQTEMTYDAASNRTVVTSRQRFHSATGTGALTSPTGSQPKARVSYGASWFDGIGRQKASANYGTNGGSSFTRPSTVPSRSDTVLVSTTEFNNDGEAYKTIDPAATENRQEFDDAGRRTKLIENYVDGDPATGSSDEDRTTEWTYTSDGQTASMKAKNSTTGDQVTTYVYGTTLSDSDVARSDLLRATIFPDSDDVASPLGNGPDTIYDRVEHRYNRQGQTKETKDQNETVRSIDFDLLGRPTQDRVTTLGSGVDGAVRRIATTYEVRGMAEKVTSYDNATVGSGSVVNEVQHTYNTFGQLVIEYQEVGGAVNSSTSPKVQYGYDDGSNNEIRLTTMTYPNGRVLNYDYGSSGSSSNLLSRISSLIDNDGTTKLVEYTFLGANAVVRAAYAEPTIRLDYAFGTGDDPNDGLDQFGRVVDQLWRNTSSGVAVARIQHGYDRASNRLWRQDSVATSNSVNLDELYAYDGLDRLEDMQRGDLNSGKTAIVGGTLKFHQSWSLDATGNWLTFKEDASGSGAWSLNQSRTSNKVNELTVIGATAGPDWADPTYDRAGNMLTIPQPAALTTSYTGTWDAWNRLVKLVDGMITVAEYVYDGKNRRAKKITGGTTRRCYFTANWHVIEERIAGSTDAQRQFVWGLRYVDDLVVRDRDTDGNGTLDERLYAVQDPNWNLIAIVTSGGGVQERYAYNAYGSTNVMTPAFAARGSTSYDWETRFASYRWDAESDIYQVRNRYLHSSLGRWIGRDRLGFIDGPNLYELHRPISGVDYDGTHTFDITTNVTDAKTAPWKRGETPEGAYAVTFTKYDIKCTCRKCDCRETWYLHGCKINITIAIILDPKKIKATPPKRGTGVEAVRLSIYDDAQIVYGHEQRHVRSNLVFINRDLEEKTRQTMKVDCSLPDVKDAPQPKSKEKCEKDAVFYVMLERWYFSQLEGGHLQDRGYPTPIAGRMYAPLGPVPPEDATLPDYEEPQRPTR